MTHQSFRQELLRVTLPLANNVVLRALIGFVQPEPHPTKIEFFEEAFTNVLPHRTVTSSANSTKRGPVAIVEENFKTAFLGELAGLHMEDDDTRLWQAEVRRFSSNINGHYPRCVRSSSFDILMPSFSSLASSPSTDSLFGGRPSPPLPTVLVASVVSADTAVNAESVDCWFFV